MTFLKDYGDTEGPLGFPMKDAEAKALDAILVANPDAEHVRLVVQKATTEFSEGERADVAWIQTEAVDHDQEIVLAAGFRDDSFKANPIVTLNHQYELAGRPFAVAQEDQGRRSPRREGENDRPAAPRRLVRPVAGIGQLVVRLQHV